MALSLDDLKPRVRQVVIVDEVGGESLTVPLAALSWSEYHRINATVPDPERPMKKVMKGNQYVYEPKTDGPEFEEWKALNNEAIAERQRRRLAVSLIRAGNLPELKSAKLEDQAAAVDEMDTAYVRVLYRAMNDLVWEAQAKLREKADNFRPDDDQRHADMPADGVDA